MDKAERERFEKKRKSPQHQRNILEVERAVLRLSLSDECHRDGATVKDIAGHLKWSEAKVREVFALEYGLVPGVASREGWVPSRNAAGQTKVTRYFPERSYLRGVILFLQGALLGMPSSPDHKGGRELLRDVGLLPGGECRTLTELHNLMQAMAAKYDPQGVPPKEEVF